MLALSLRSEWTLLDEEILILPPSFFKVHNMIFRWVDSLPCTPFPLRLYIQVCMRVKIVVIKEHHTVMNQSIKYCLFWHGQSFLFGAPATKHLWAAPMWCTVGKWRDKCFPVPIFHLGQCPKSSISLLWGVAHFPSPQNQGQGHGHGNDTGAIQDHGADTGFCIAAKFPLYLTISQISLFASLLTHLFSQHSLYV